MVRSLVAWRPGGLQTWLRGFLVGWGVLCLSRLFAAEAPYYSVTYPPSTTPGELIFGVTFNVWIPPGVERLRGIIVHQHGCGRGACQGGVTGANDLHWQALAKKWDCALLAPAYQQADTDDCRRWCDPRNGSGTTFLRALQDLADRSQHPELAKVPWCLWGHSGGAFWASLMQAEHPERIVAIWFRSGTAYTAWTKGEIPQPMVPAAALQIPIMCNPGAKERDDERFHGAWDGSLAMFQEYRRRGALIGFAPDPHTSHECGDSRYLAIRFFDACLAARLPARESVTAPLRPCDPRSAWSAKLLSSDSHPATSLAAVAPDDVWLPSEAFARAWSDYVQSGSVSDTTLPSAPTNVRLRSLGEGGAELLWDVDADLESGLRAFRIFTDGREIAIEPSAGDSTFGRPLFQGMTYHDTPQQPIRAMRWKVPEGLDPSTLEVAAINSVGLESSRTRVHLEHRSTGKSN